MKYDQIIIGAGLSGLFSAYLLAKQNQNVCLIAKGYGSLYLSNGCIDKLGYVGDEKSNDLTKLTDHPYNLVDEDTLKASFAEFMGLTREIGMPYTGSTEQNRFFPTAVGTLRPTCLYPELMDKDILTEKDIMVVGIEECVDFYSKLLCEGLSRHLPDAQVGHTTVSIGYQSERSLNSFDIANYIDSEEQAQQLVKALVQKNLQGKLVILPPVLSLKNHRQLVVDIETACSCKVLEAASLPPALPGIRLYHALEKKVKDMGVKVLMGMEVRTVKKAEGKVQSVSLTMANGREKEYHADTFIAATGSALSGGIVVGIEKIEEPLFHLPVEQPEGLMDSMFETQPQGLSAAGVTVTENMKSEIDNLYAVGALIKGSDPYVEKSGNGIALVTAYKAVASIMEGKNNG